MNANYVSHALCFHGQPLQKIWDDERGIEDLRKMRILQPNYSVYQERQKFFTFQERAKRLKLHQFLARKAEDLYDRELVANVMEDEVLAQGRSHIAQLPPFECFMHHVKDKNKWWQYRLHAIKPGDVIYAAVVKTLSVGLNRVIVKPLCTAMPKQHVLADMPLKAYILQEYLGPLPLNKQGIPRSFNNNDFVCCEVFEVSVDAERMTLGMTGVLTKSNHKLGLVDMKDFPGYYRKAHGLENEDYEYQLKSTPEFANPNYETLYQMNGLNINDNFTLMRALKFDFPREEYARELRGRQASTWAFHYVAEGIERFKNGQQIEAFQCLNKALNIDPRNVEGLVARGALYANKGSFLKAIEDFEKALALNSFHVNARKYMGETLVALGHSYEEDQRIPEAVKAYNDCLQLIPNHEQARISLNALQRPLSQKQYTADGLLQLPTAGGIGGVNKGDPSRECEIIANAATDSAVHKKLMQAKRDDYSQRSLYVPAKSTHSSTTKNFNEFKLDDDETVTQVRKLLREASKHKKSKKKSEKEKSGKKNKKSKRDSDLDQLEYMQKLDFEQAYRIMAGNSADAVGDGTNSTGQLKESLQMYERSIAEIKKRQMQASSVSSSSQTGRQYSESPPPAPSLSSLTHDDMAPSTSKRAAANGARSLLPTTPATSTFGPQKLSFQIKRPVKVDKFGLVRVATPLINSNRSVSRSRSPSRGRDTTANSRTRQLASTRREFSPSRSRSRSRSPGGRRFTSSHSSSRRHSRSRSSDRFRHFSSSHYHSSRYRRRHKSRTRTPPDRHRRWRRTPSPFVPRGTPSPQSRYRRSQTPSDDYDNYQHKRGSSRSRSPRRYGNRDGGQSSQQQARKTFGNRVWQRRRSQEDPDESSADEKTAKSPRKASKSSSKSPLAEPTIEEIDEIINQAQKERKQEIIKRDKNILKKAAASDD